MINRTYRFDLNRPRSRHEPKFCKYEKCLSKIMLISNTKATFESLSLSLSIYLSLSLSLSLLKKQKRNWTLLLDVFNFVVIQFWLNFATSSYITALFY